MGHWISGTNPEDGKKIITFFYYYQVMKLLITGGSGFIGTNAVEYFIDRGFDVLNVDIQEPANVQQAPNYLKVDIMDKDALRAAFSEFRPEAVIHMAARADCDENTTVETGYRMNTVGTRNVLEAIKESPTVGRAIIVSSQFVCGADYPPKDDEDFHPVTVYGQSKVITEQLTREAGLSCCWTIVRPTNIWGPWHKRYTQQFWRVAAKGWYLHPGGKPVTRCYGYVGNLVAHLDAILASGRAEVDRQVLYLSDPADDIYRWADAFCRGLGSGPARRVPRSILRLLGVTGDLISKISGKPFYISSSRVRSMTSDYVVPGVIEKTISVLGAPKYSLEEGVNRTLVWLEAQRGPDARGGA